MFSSKERANSLINTKIEEIIQKIASSQSFAHLAVLGDFERY